MSGGRSELRQQPWKRWRPHGAVDIGHETVMERQQMFGAAAQEETIVQDCVHQCGPRVNDVENCPHIRKRFDVRLA
jgi:hypothetical protein